MNNLYNGEHPLAMEEAEFCNQFPDYVMKTLLLNEQSGVTTAHMKSATTGPQIVQGSLSSFLFFVRGGALYCHRFASQHIDSIEDVVGGMPVYRGDFTGYTAWCENTGVVRCVIQKPDESLVLVSSMNAAMTWEEPDDN